MRSLSTGLSRADVAVDPDRAEQVWHLEVERLGIAYQVRVFHLAPDCDGQAVVFRFLTKRRTVRRPTQREITLAIGQFDKLRQDLSGKT